MDKLIYTRGTRSNEIQKVELEVSEDMDLPEFKRVCKRLACALGYDSASVEKAFEDKISPANKLKQILKG
jgi:hypothetical protein|tara:strand:- start:399 stop:608 length:210 start_codon:yes stop_codon:yes gene_type:complete